MKLQGAVEMLKWLNDPCTEHDLYLFHCEQKSKYDHRKDCPLCWKLCLQSFDMKEEENKSSEKLFRNF
jgi:hypothetical protein